jgi:Icc-related predicted phosphoesterase
MKALLFSDIHNDFKTLDRLLGIEADYYFAAGDMVSWSRGLDKAGETLRRRADRVYVLPGNHESASQITTMCEQFGLHDFHGKSMEIDGMHFAGLGYSSPTPFDTPGEYTEAQIAQRLAPFAALNPLVLVCHAPPQGTRLDYAGPGRHFGSASVREFIETHQPAYFFCGHVHESEGVQEHIGSTLCVNVGKKGYLLEL